MRISVGGATLLLTKEIGKEYEIVKGNLLPIQRRKEMKGRHREREMHV